MNAQRVNQFDENKQRTGVWKKYYPNKRIRYEGNFKNGKEVGVFKFYDITNSKQPVVIKTFFEENYKEGKLNGAQLIYYKDGKVTEFAVYEDGLKQGVTSKYASNGNLIEEITYKKGKPNGLAKYFELDGSLKERGHYKDGKRIGSWAYYLDGEIATDEEKKKKKSTYVKKKNN
jgi:antitoxin component YwqK of YwqJK toxin-antitoxin module